MRLLRMSETRSAVLVRPRRARSSASPLNCSAMPGIQPQTRERNNRGIEGSLNDPLRYSSPHGSAPRPPSSHCEVLMSTTPPPQALTDQQPATEAPAEDGALGWFRALGPRGRRAFAG